MDDREYEAAIRMIDNIYKDLYKSEEVVHNSKNVYNKFDNIKSYIERLERIHDRVKNNPRYIGILKKYYYDKYIIKPENIPNSYYEHYKQISFERGYGKIEITEDIKKQLQQQIIKDQKASLDAWLDYFFSDDSSYIPMWAKFWAFQGMLKLGTYDKEKNKFNKRNKNNVNIFVDLNREALALSIDYIKKIINKENIEDKDLEQLLKAGSFGKIYEYVLNNQLNNNKDIVKKDDGVWIKYEQGSDHRPLVKSLQGYNTGWCTAGDETAKKQLSGGDFYVYYTKDENNEYRVPRIAIRMEENSIGEIRGIGKNQNIESSMEKIVEEKIKDFPDKERYLKKVHNMEYLTYIYERNRCGGNLSANDLRFLYEIDDKIEGFGYDDDPRIEEIRNSRNFRKDLALVFDCREDEIAITMEELSGNPSHFVCLWESLSIVDDIPVNMTKLKYVLGDVDCWSDKIEGLNKLQMIRGTAEFHYLGSAEGLENLQVIGGSASFPMLESAAGLGNLQSIGQWAEFDLLESSEGLENLQVIGWDANFPKLKNARGLISLQSIGGDADFPKLERSEGLENLQLIGRNVDFKNLKSAEGLVNLQKIGYLPSITGFYAYFSSLASAKGLENLQSVGGSVDFNSLRNAKGLEHLQSIGGTAHFDSLISIEGLEHLQSIGGNAYFNLSIGNKEHLQKLRFIDEPKKLILLSNLNNFKVIKDKEVRIIASENKTINENGEGKVR